MKSVIPASRIARRRGQRIVLEPGTRFEEYLRVVGFDHDTMTVVRWRWYHAVMGRPGLWWHRFRWWLLCRRVAFWDWQEARQK